MSIWKKLFGGGKSTDAPATPSTPPSRPETPTPATRTPASPTAATPHPQAAKDRVVRVFVSSTFKDMIADRNELMAQVWPALRKTCRGRDVEFVEVDLRWGVTEEQSQRKETLRHCLAEIKRCKPFFIGLLGERYGWTPGAEAYSEALLDEEKWLKYEVAKHSVTELEILHGVLRGPEMAGRSFFYFRDPKYAQAQGGDCLPEDDANKSRQDDLKARVKTVCEAKHIPLRENYADPAALAALVLKDLSDAIDAEFPADQTPDVWSREDRDHEAYARSRRTAFYVGRAAYFNRLDTHAREGANGCGLTVLGESGGGKSALLANWTHAWRKAHPDDFVFQHFIGSSAMSAGHLALMRRLMVAILRWERADQASETRDLEEEEKKIPAQADDIVKAFPEYLTRLAFRAKQKGVRAILVFDALNQLEDRENGRLLAWLPHRLPGELRLIVSTLKGTTLDALQPRAWPAMTVEPLTPEERIQVIARYLKHFSQGLSDARARKIAGVGAASNPLYIKTLLDDLRATGDHLKLDEQIADYLKAADIPALFDMILTRFEIAYERDRPELVRDALSLLWAARRGLTEPELLEALRPADQDRLPAAIWSPVRCALEDGLVDRDGVLAFAHEHLRAAVERRYVADQDHQDDYRLRLADDFEKQPVSARNCDELPWLLKETDSRVRLRACLLNMDRFLLIQKRDDNELLGYWVWLKEERSMGQPYVQAFHQWAGGKGETTTVSYAANQLAAFLYSRAALHAEAEPLMRRALKIDEDSYGENHPFVAIRLNNLAWLLKKTNRQTEAEPFMRRALKIAEGSYGENHPDVVTCLCNLAQLLSATNRHTEAEPMMRRALKIAEGSYGDNHPDLAIPLCTLAQLLQATNRLSEAEPLIRRALKIAEGSYGKNHPSVAICLNTLAGLLQATNRLSEAEPLMRRALLILESSYGENHPDVASDLSSLAGLLYATNRLTEAELLYRRALKIDVDCFGENHPDVARDLNNLAGLLQATCRLTEAELLYRRALKIDEDSYGENHPNTATHLSNLAQLLQATNRLSEAEPMLRRALEIDVSSYGENHPRVARDLGNLATLLYGTNRDSEAEPLYRRALEIDEGSYGENHPAVALDLNNLASLLCETNRHSEAEPLMRRAVEIVLEFTRRTGHRHPHLQTFLGNYGILLEAIGHSQAQARKAVEALCGRYGVNLLE